MEPGEYLRVLRRRLWVVVLVTLVVVGAALGWSLTRDSTYSAHGEIVLGSGDGATPDVPTQAQVMASQAVHLLALKDDPTAQPVVANQADAGDGIRVEVESRDPKVAADSVNAHIDAYVTYVRQRAQDRYDQVSAELAPQISSLQQQIAALDAQVAAGMPASAVANQRNALVGQLGLFQNQLQQLQVAAVLAGRNIDIVTRATPPANPTSPKPEQTGLIALGAGLLLGVLAALLLEFADDTVRTRQDLVRVSGGDVPVMGVIPSRRSGIREIVSLTAPYSPAAEAYRSLRTAVQFATPENGRCIEVTSPRSRDGKTETLVNLAVLAARAGQRVVVVDCDMRNPRVHDLFDLPNDAGFTSVVYGEPLSQTLKRVPGIDRLYVLPTGPLPANPAELLASRRAQEVLASLQTDDTLVLVDTPPVLLVTDAIAMLPGVGGVLLVATARVTRRKQLRQALERLRESDAHLMGMVLYQADSAETGGFGQEEGRRDRRAARRRQEALVAGAPDTPVRAVSPPDIEVGAG